MKKNLRNTLLLVLSLLSTGAFATNYYVSALTGNNGYSGTVGQPFATIQYAANLTNPGDTVFIMNGTYNSTNNPVFQQTRSGVAGQYITFKNYAGHNPLITASGNVWNACVINASYIVVDGLEFMGNNANITYAQAYQAYQDYKSGTIGPQANFNTNCLSIGTAGNPHHVTVRNCKVHDFPAAGVGGGHCDYITIENNLIYNNSWYTMYATSGISILDPISIDTVTGYKMFIRKNICYGNKTTIPWAQISALSDGNGIIIDVNTGSTGAPAYAGRTLVENNISYYNGGSGIHAYKAAHVDIINNTAYSNGNVVGYSEIYSNTGTDNKIINNIMYARTGGKAATNSGNVNVTYDYNVYYNGVADVMGSNDIVANPQFTNLAFDGTADFHLKDISPAINAGNNTPGLYSSTDIAGVARPVGPRPDMGAYEFTGTPAVIPNFTAGNIAALRVGDGTNALGANATAVQVLEYTPTGGAGAMNVVLGSAVTATADTLVLSGDNTTYEGQLSLTPDGKYLAVAGYKGLPGDAQATYRAKDKIIVRLSYNGTVDYSTRISAATLNGTIRSTVTSNNLRYYITGVSTSPASTNSTRFLNFGTPVTTTSTAFFGSVRSLASFSGQIYYSQNNTVGSLTPVAASGNYGTSVLFPGVSISGHNYTQLALLDVDATASYLGTGYDVLYCADITLGLVKFYWNGTTWVLAGVFNPASTTGVTGGIYALGARLNSSGIPEIVAVKGAASNNQVLLLTDASGFTGNITTTVPAVINIAAAGNNNMFRGVAFAPAQSGTLPVELLSFQASVIGNSVRLNWATASEINTREFVIEKSLDGTNFSFLSSVAAKNLANGASYSLADKDAGKGQLFYRLKSVDKNGAFTYSKTVSVFLHTNVTDQLQLFPNPVISYCTLSYPLATANAFVSIYTADGKKLSSYQVAAGSTQTGIDVSAFAKGSYFIVYNNGNKISTISFNK